jgi:hypothetical protein
MNSQSITKNVKDTRKLLHSSIEQQKCPELRFRPGAVDYLKIQSKAFLNPDFIGPK